MRTARTMLILIVLAALAVPAIATAHVTLQPDEAPAGAFTRLDVRVPNERDDSGTVQVQVQFPSGFHFASTEPVPGWTAKITRAKLDTPIEGAHGPITEEIRRITWTGRGVQGVIKPGEFQDFGLSTQIPDIAGEPLTFKALQTYASGEVVRWIGEPDSDQPAPVVTVVAAADAEAPAPAPAAADAGGDDGAPVWLAVTGLVAGVLGLIAGGLALASSRRGGGPTA
jgi:uncharacterized protein YcnI